jgi:phytoene dehydrogenase-like protein
MSKHVIVIGAGIAGLTAAIYARRSGFDVTLIEQHRIAGGMCTSWKRKGYLFEGGIHWLIGSSPETEAYQIWRETGALDDTTQVILHDPFHSVDCNGQIVHLYRDIDKTARHLIELSPEDAPLIKQLVKDVRALSRMQMPVFDIKGVKAEAPRKMSLGFLLRILPAMGAFKRLSKLSCAEYCKQFKHPGLQRLLDYIPGRYTALSLAFTLATLNIGDGGYPMGGSLAMVKRMVKTYLDLGGTLLMNTKVKRVVIDNGVATGVELEKRASSGKTSETDLQHENASQREDSQQHEGEILSADAVIITQETISALDALFDEPLEDAWLEDLRQTTKPSTCTFVCVGVSTRLPERILPEWQLSEPIHYAGQTVTKLSFNNYGEYEGYAPEGGMSLTTAFVSDTYDDWKQLLDEGRYDAERQQLAVQISRALCMRYPELEGKIEVIDIATPLTYERYTGAYHGSWMSITEPGDKNKSYPGFVDSVQRLYFAGHRMSPPGGFPVAAASGRTAAQMVCREFGVVFR